MAHLIETKMFMDQETKMLGKGTMVIQAVETIPLCTKAELKDSFQVREIKLGIVNRFTAIENPTEILQKLGIINTQTRDKCIINGADFRNVKTNFWIAVDEFSTVEIMTVSIVGVT